MRKRQQARAKDTVWNDLLDGFRYVRRRPRVSLLLSISAFTSMFGAPYLSMMPLFARDVMHFGEKGLALMMGTAGTGAFCGALLLAFLGDFRRKGLFVLTGAFSFGVCLIGFALANNVAVSLALLFGVGFSVTSSVALINTLLQQLVTDEMRGRVLSMFVLTFLGTLPFGSFLAGAAAARYGASYTLATGGVLIVIFISILFVKARRLRQL